jgi:threonine/homoserine/homoserine lactone efflux protein
MLGLTAILAESARAFEIVKWAGAGYLFYLGARALMRAWNKSTPVGLEPVQSRLVRSMTWGRVILKGYSRTCPKYFI